MPLLSWLVHQVPFLCNRTDLTREQLLLDLANGRIVLFWMGIAVTTVAVGVLGYALIKYAQTVSQNSPSIFSSFPEHVLGSSEIPFALTCKMLCLSQTHLFQKYVTLC
jgi:hypothetical protein